MTRILLAATALVGLAAMPPAQATQIAAFAQTSASNTVTATDNGTVTNLSASGASTDISQLFLNAPVSGALFGLTAHSIDAVQTVGGALLQHYSGTFCLTAAAGCGGTNYLSGTFTDAAFGGLGGPGLVVNVNNPPDSLVLTSSVIPAANLIAPNTFSLGFSNIADPPGLAIDGTTIGAFTASFAGTASANTQAAPEPTTLALLGVGLLGLGLVRRARS